MFSCFLEFFLLVAGGPCCSAGSSTPSLITSDAKAQVSLGFSNSWIVGNTPESGPALFYTESAESSFTSAFSGALALSDRFQAGASLPIVFREVERSQQEASSTGVGDLKLNLGYEFLPELYYSEWKPKGYLYLFSILPTGSSKNESLSFLHEDAFGKGFFSVGLGTLFLKQWKRWDAQLITEIRYSFPRTFQVRDVSTRYEPNFGGSALITTGYSFGSSGFRTALRAGPHIESPESYESELTSGERSYRMVWDAGLEATYSVTTEMMLGLSYNDQSLLGPTKNTDLSRSLALSFSYHWDR